MKVPQGRTLVVRRQHLKENALALGCTVIANVKVDQGAPTASGTAVCLRP
jgi:hypothetical protein